MPRYRLFISSVQQELAEERRVIKDLVEKNYLLNDYFKVFLFEDISAKSKSSKRTYLEEVAKTDVYIGLLGNEYGRQSKDGLSAIEREFREAKKREKQILIFIKGKTDSKRDKRIEILIEEIQDPEIGYTYKRFDTLSQLTNYVHESLVDFLREEGIVGKTIFDEAICKGASIEDIDESKIKWFLDRAKKKRTYPLDVNTPIIKVLTHLNLLDKGELKSAAILLFGKEPHKFYLQAEVKCLQFPGTKVEKPFFSYHIYTENVFEQIDKAVAFVFDAIKLPVIQQTGTAAVSRPLEIPEFVIQEAIVNAVAHRNYNNTAGVQVMVFIDRVEVWNPGKLPAQITIDELKKPHTSHPNNPLLADMLYLADYIQKAGSGTLEMVKQCSNKGLPEPEFEQLRSEFRCIIARDIYTDSLLATLGLKDRQIKAIKYVKEKGEIANKEYQQVCDVSERTASRDLSDLVDRGIFIQIGATGKGTKYRLKTSHRRQSRHKAATKTPKGSKD